MSSVPPGMTRWNVIIEFKDSSFECRVVCYSKETAYSLALQDARMASTNPIHMSEVVAKFITVAS